MAYAAYAGIPLSHRDFGSSISFLTGHEDVAKESLRVDFAKFSEVGGTLCIYMGMSKLDEIVDKLIAGGLSQIDRRPLFRMVLFLGKEKF